MKYNICNRVISKVSETQHQNPEFGHKWGEIFKKPAKKYVNVHQRIKLRKPSIFVVNRVSSCLSFFLSACTAVTYIFTATTCTATIISFEPSALNAEFQQFIPNLIKFPYFTDTIKRGVWGRKEAERQGDFIDNSNMFIPLCKIKKVLY
jgi:hypothetical protein